MRQREHTAQGFRLEGGAGNAFYKENAMVWGFQRPLPNGTPLYDALGDARSIGAALRREPAIHRVDPQFSS